MAEILQITQTVVFTLLVFSAVLTFLNKTQWLALIPGIAAISYYCMATDPTSHELYRYSDWFLTTPLMIAALLISNGSPFKTIISASVLDMFMIATGYFGVKEEDKQKKIAWFIAGALAFLPIVYILLTQQFNTETIYLTIALWTLYPIVWMVSELHYIDRKQTGLVYAILDSISKIGFVSLIKL